MAIDAHRGIDCLLSPRPEGQKESSSVALALAAIDSYRLRYLLENGAPLPFPRLGLPGYDCMSTDFCLKGQLRRKDWPDLGAWILMLRRSVCRTDAHKPSRPVELVPRLRPRMFPASPLPLQVPSARGNHHPA